MGSVPKASARKEKGLRGSGCFLAFGQFLKYVSFSFVSLTYLSVPSNFPCDVYSWMMCDISLVHQPIWLLCSFNSADIYYVNAYGRQRLRPGQCLCGSRSHAGHQAPPLPACRTCTLVLCCTLPSRGFPLSSTLTGCITHRIRGIIQVGGFSVDQILQVTFILVSLVGPGWEKPISQACFSNISLGHITFFGKCWKNQGNKILSHVVNTGFVELSQTFDLSQHLPTPGPPTFLRTFTGHPKYA